MDELEREAIKTTALLIAAEDWSKQYAKDQETYATLIKKEAAWNIRLVRFFNNISKEIDTFINWNQYNNQVNADFNVDVIVDYSNMDDYSNEFMRISLEFVTAMTAAGAQAGENIYGIKLGISSIDEAIQKLSTKQIANLVGKKVLKDGSIVDNPNAAYNITETMRRDIAEAVRVSLNTGETIQEARDRITKVIKDPRRADRIARTESVNAYQSGLAHFGDVSGAVGKEWLDVGAIDVCAMYSDLGPVPLDYKYDGMILNPVAHPGCRCGIRLIYQREWESISNK